MKERRNIEFYETPTQSSLAAATDDGGQDTARVEAAQEAGLKPCFNATASQASTEEETRRLRKLGRAMKRFLARQKLRFNYGMSYMPVVTLAVMIVGLSDGLYARTGLHLRVLFPILFGGSLIGVWFWGWLQDVWGLIHAEITEMNERNEAMKKIDKHLDRQQ